MNRIREGFICALLLGLFVVGCTKKPKTALQHFKDTQINTNTPHGRIKPQSIKAAPDDKIEYETESGHSFRVLPKKNENGEYSYHFPEQIK